jgi:hypothetical protein
MALKSGAPIFRTGMPVRQVRNRFVSRNPENILAPFVFQYNAGWHRTVAMRKLIIRLIFDRNDMLRRTFHSVANGRKGQRE